MKKATFEERKVKAIEIMKRMDIYHPYIEAFEKDNTVCFFENYAGFWAYQEPEIQNKIKELEKEYNFTIYAVTHEYMEFGECFSFLYVSSYKEDWEYNVQSCRNTHYAFAYVWNKDDDWCSELGTIGVKSFGGGIKRIS